MSRLIQVLAIIGFMAASCSDSRGPNFAGSGTLEAVEIELSAVLAGRLTQVIPREGDMVEEGDTVAVLDTDAIELQKEQLERGFDELDLGIQQAEQGVEQAQIAYDTIEKNYSRIRNLYRKGVSTQSQYDEVKAKYEAADAQLKGAKLAKESLVAKRKTMNAQLDLINRQLEEGVVRSTISGQVIERFVEPGEVVSPGRSIVTVADLSVMKLKIYISEPDMGRMKLAGYMNVKVDAFPDEVFRGRVAWVSPKAEFTPRNVETRDARAELVYAVKLEIENPDRGLKIGMPADSFFE